MINLGRAVRAALEHDHEFRGDEVEVTPFENNVELEDVDSLFNFELTPVAATMESQRFFSKRHRIVATEGIALEELGGTFWKLLAVAVAAGVLIIGKMLGWFDGSSSGGGGGGGGGGGAIAATSKRIDKVTGLTEQVNNLHVEILSAVKAPEVRAVVNKSQAMTEYHKHVFHDFSQYDKELGEKNSSLTKALGESMGHLEKMGDVVTTVCKDIGELADNWEGYFEMVDANSEDIKRINWQKCVDVCKRVSDSNTGVHAPSGKQKWQDSYQYKLIMFGTLRSELAQRSVTFSESEGQKWLSAFLEMFDGGVDGLKKTIAELEQNSKVLSDSHNHLATVSDEFFGKMDKYKADAVDFSKKDSSSKHRQLNMLLGLNKGSGANEQFQTNLKNAQDVTREAFREALELLRIMTRHFGNVLTHLNHMLTLFERNRSGMRTMLATAKAQCKAAGVELPQELLDAEKALK